MRSFPLIRRRMLRGAFNGVVVASGLCLTSLLALLQFNGTSSGNFASITNRSFYDLPLQPSPAVPAEELSDDDVSLVMRPRFAGLGPVGPSLSQQQPHPVAHPVHTEPALTSVKCDINGDYFVDCLYYKNSVYMPFEFISKYFESFGQFKTETAESSHNQQPIFQFRHTNVGHLSSLTQKLVGPEGPDQRRGDHPNSVDTYSCADEYLNFAGLHVERRSRVKFIAISSGVPMSIQWDPAKRGYYFPTQIAQFGLSYYSKLVSSNRDPASQTTIMPLQFQMVKQSNCQTTPTSNNSVSNFQFNCSSSTQSRLLVLDTAATPLGLCSKFPILNITFGLSACHSAIGLHISFTIHLSTSETRALVANINYRCDGGSSTEAISSSMSVDGKRLDIVYSIQNCSLPMHSLYRHLALDIAKSLTSGVKNAPSAYRKISATDVTIQAIESISFTGSGFFGGASLLTSANREFALAAAEWFVENQDAHGGWPVPIARQIRLIGGHNHTLDLKAGWLDAMSQGQAMSMLVRAYAITQHSAYANAALKALEPFYVEASNNGLVNKLFGTYTWFEEYPTNPGLYVLNGFIYSLVGLYDVATCLRVEAASKLLEIGLDTLQATLSLFDAGSATFYDLRHISIPGVEPNVARWEYHATHVNQLQLLAQIDTNATRREVWEKTVARWLGYMKGIRAHHN